MQRVGEVTAVEGDILEVTFCRPADCGKCHACIGGQNKAVIRIKGKAQVGDAAVVDMPTDTVIKASLIGYILPLAGLLGGVIIGSLTAGTDAAAAIGGLLGLAVSGGIVAIGEKKRRSGATWQPVLKQILPGEGAAAAEKEDI